MQNKGVKYCLFFFFIMLLGDFFSTLLLWDLIKYLEVNPIYEMVGLGGIVLVNLALAYGLYYLYKKTKYKTKNRFVFLNLLTTISILRIVVIWNNIQVYLSEPTLQQAQAVTQAAKRETIAHFWWISFVPYLIAYVTFWFFSKDHDIEAK